MSKHRCGRKVCYSLKEAKDLVIKRSAEKGRPSNYYHHTKCGWYHLTKRIDWPDDGVGKEIRAAVERAKRVV